MNWVTITLCLLIICGPAYAQMEVYLCIDENGKREYKNKGDTAGCKKVDLPGLTSMTNLPRDESASTLRIKRSPNGHFEIYGKVNGVSVPFLVDTGASAVSISEDLARQANLSVGTPVKAETANGVTMGRLIAKVPVSVGTLAPLETSVLVGVVGSRHALLGQSFLAHFDIQITGNNMVLRARPKASRASDF